MFEIIGKIEFDPVNVTKKHDKQSSWKKVAMVRFQNNDDTYAYYSWFLKKRFNLVLNKPIRDIRSNKKGHWWLKAYCDDAHNIRTVMGLDPKPYFGLHITIGLATHLQLEHSKYITDQCIRFDL